MRQWLSRLAPVYPGEGSVVWLCFAVNFLVVAGIMFGRNARDSLFLTYVGVRYLPYMYFANAVFLVLCSLAYTTLVDRVDRGKFLGGVSLIFVACLVLSRLVLVGRPHWFFPVLYVEAQVIWYFSVMQFWTFVGDLFETRQAKRLFPLLGVGALLGMISVGVTSKKLVHGLGTANLLLVWAGLVFTALILGGVVYRRYRSLRPATVDKACASNLGLSEWRAIKDGFREVGRDPLLRCMTGYILLLWTVYAIVDFCFNSSVRARYPDPNDLTTFLGHFIGVAGFLSLVVQLFFTRAVISRLGIGTTINFHPGFLVFGAAWMSIQYSLGSVLTTKVGDHVMLYTFSDSSYQLLYNPVPPERRARVRGFIEGYIRPVSLAAAGLLVLIGNSYLKPLSLFGRQISTVQQLSWAALILAITWLSVTLGAKNRYLKALLHNLQAYSASLRQAAAIALTKLKDPTSRSVLLKALRNEKPELVVAALQFLESFGTEDAADAVAALLSHPEARVRATAVSALGRLAAAKYLDRLTPLLSDPEPRVRANVIEALAAAQDPALADKLRPLLHDPSMRVRLNAVLTLMAMLGISVGLEWLPFIRELAHGDQKARSAATYALARLPLDQSMDVLSELLNDPELSIRCQAAEALGHIGSGRAIPSLIEALAGPPELRHAARRSLAAITQKYGEETARLLANTALSSDRAEIRSELADVLGRLPQDRDSQVPATLMSLLKDPEWRVRWKAVKSFERLAQSPQATPLPESARSALLSYARDELVSFRQSLLCSQTLTPHQGSEGERVLSHALEEDRMRIEERVFHVLGILCGQDRMLAIFEKLRSGDTRLRADALEALDNLAPKEIVRDLMGLLEPEPTLEETARPQVRPLITALAHHPKPWIRACTAYYLGYQRPHDADSLLPTLLEDRDQVVRETALYAGWRAFKDAWQPHVHAAMQSPDPALRRCAQRILADEGDVASGSHLGVRRPVGGANLVFAYEPVERPDERNTPMLLTVEKVLLLKSAPLFAGLDSEELAALAEVAFEQDYKSGEIIFEQHRVPKHLYLIVRGKVEVFYRVDTAERRVAVLGERECFGEMAILDDDPRPRSASVRAVEPTLVLKIDRDNFRELIIERPQIAFAIFKLLTSRLRHKNLEADTLSAFDAGRHYA